MANQDALGLANQINHAGDYGNVAVATKQITLSAAAVGDVFRFAKLPAYSRLLDLKVIHTAAGTGTTMTFGYEAANGSVAAVPAYFNAATAIAAAGVIRANAANAPVEVTTDSYITGTLAGANIATATTITVQVSYEYLNR